MNGQNLYLKPEEAKFIGMAVVALVEDLQATSRNQLIPWTPESRKTLKDMLDAGTTLRTKLTKLGFDMRPLPPFLHGDEKDFLTKES
jgi:hypothetical protein